MVPIDCRLLLQLRADNLKPLQLTRDDITEGTAVGDVEALRLRPGMSSVIQTKREDLDVEESRQSAQLVVAGQTKLEVCLGDHGGGDGSGCRAGVGYGQNRQTTRT